MTNKLLIISLIISTGFSLTELKAQESINATGGNATGTGGTISYSAGQVTYQTFTGTTGSLAEGIQHTYEISEVTGIEQAKNISISVSAYPNPANDFLILEVEGSDISNLSIQLYDMQGKLINVQRSMGKQTKFLTGNLEPGAYLLKVVQGEREVKIFNIIKN